MFCKGGPGKNHQARLPGALVGLEGLSFISSCTELWNTVYTHIMSNFSSWVVPMERVNSSPVPLNFRPRNISPYTAFIRGRPYTWFGSAESWSNILCPNIRCVSSCYNTLETAPDSLPVYCLSSPHPLLLLTTPRPPAASPPPEHTLEPFPTTES